MPKLASDAWSVECFWIERFSKKAQDADLLVEYDFDDGDFLLEYIHPL